MSVQKPTLIYTMFPFCNDNDRLSADLSAAMVTSAVINGDKTAMKLTLTLVNPVPPAEIKAIEDIIAHEYGLSSVNVTTVYARTAVDKKKSQPVSAAKADTVIMGRRIKDTVTQMDKITLELGKVTVSGEVCNTSSRFIEKNGAWILSFDLTDFTSTIHISKYMTGENAERTVQSIQPNMWLTVSGKLSISRFNDDLTLEPSNIVTAERIAKTDTAEEKRVELHLHTKMSALDAVTDTAEVIRRAVQWGHPAVAITDHGVVHSFPDAAHAAGDKIKVIYGIEGYFNNDLDYSTAVFDWQEVAASDKITRNADKPVPLAQSEFVVFDIETTGLSVADAMIIEIGAVLVKDGRELDSFNTFVNPELPIPHEITRLTGIKDEDVANAPLQKEALGAFLQFVGDRRLVAYNAGFDVGFIFEACQRFGIDYQPSYIDCLAMARCILPQLKNHKLNMVAGHLGRGAFGHHRALEDASATGYIFDCLIKTLEKDGITELGQVNSHLAKLHSENPNVKKTRNRNKHIILLAKNQTGLRNLYKLVTRSHLQDFERHPIIRKSALIRHRDGLIVGSACEAGEVFDSVVQRRGFLEQMRVAGFYDYLEIQPIGNNLFMLSGDKARVKNVDELRSLNERIIQIGRRLGKPVVATGDTHFLNPEDEIFRRILISSKGFEGANDDLPIYFKTTDEMLDEFAYLGKETAYEVVVKNSRMIADMCQTLNPLPDKLFPPKLEGSAEQLKELVYGKLKDLYGDNPPEIVVERLETELSDILDSDYDVIYMAAQKLVAESMKHGYLVGSRGSVGSSFVAFLAGITEVNAMPAHYRCPACRNSDFESGSDWGCGADMPDAKCIICGEKYAKDGFNIPFETFLGFGGDKVPDIDLNFSGEFQARAHKFTIELFGADNVFRAGTIGKIANKTAYGYVKSYLDGLGKTVTKAEENRLARGCVGVKRTTGQHPGGLIIIPQGMEITDFCPAQHPADSRETDIITTHFDYDCLEDNLIKLDALGHDDPTMLRMLEDMTGIAAVGISLCDPDTLEIFTSPISLGLPKDDDIIGATGTIGIPEFGTPLTRQMLADTMPKDFDTLVRLSGYAHGTGVWHGNSRDLILTGKATVGETISCRDDIMLYLISSGMDDRYAFSISENVRKGKGLSAEAEEKMIQHGVPGWYIESCNKIQYLFPKAHAVAYVMMAFRIAWFKAHKPLEFYSAYFYRRSQKDSFDAGCMTRGISVALAKIKEIKNNPEAKVKEEELLTTLEACYEFYLRGFEFVGIDLYESDPTKFLIADEKKLRPPLIAVSGLGETVANDIAENRSGREFISIEDITSACTKITKANIEQLKLLGTLRGLPETSQMSLF